MPLFTRTPSTNEVGLEKAIDAVLAEMQMVSKNSDDYALLIERLETLYNLKTIDQADRPKKISADTALLVAGNLLGILAIIGYEHSHVVATKALNFVLKAPVTPTR